MPRQYEDPPVKKADDKMESAESANKKIERIADKAAGKSAKTIQRYEKKQKIISI